MDTSAKKILETVAIKTLHAQGFSKSSTHANLVLSDVLSRYLSSLALTVAEYARHANRRSLAPQDAFKALDDMGTSVDELRDFCLTEGRDMARYATHSSKRLEDLNDFRAHLATGLSHDEDDLIPLVWAPVPDVLPSEEEEESEEEELETPQDELAKSDVIMVDTEDVDAEGEEDVQLEEQPDILKTSISRRRQTPPLPLSPVSNPSTPPRKRQRTAKWNPPEYVPDFLPPFPSSEPPLATPHNLAAPTDPASLPGNAVKMERPPTPPLQAQVSTASSSADYHTIVPYEQSSLAALSPRHLPPPTPPSDSTHPRPQPVLQPHQAQQALLGAYHHILTHPPPARPSAVNPGRYRVALAFVKQSEKYNRWDAPTTLYGGPAPNPLRVAVMPPSHPVPIAKGPPGGSGSGSGTGTPDGSGSGNGNGKEEEKKMFMPPVTMKTIAPVESVCPSLSRPGSRIPALAKDVLSPAVYNRTTRILHPPVLQRGNEKLTYGPGVNAPWNSNLAPTQVATPATARGKDGNANGVPNGKEKDKEAPRPFPDARLYATWSYEQKRFDEPLPVRRRVGSIAVPPAAVPPGRARSESTNA